MLQLSQPATVSASRLPPPRSFAEATALVEAALGQLRNAEAALEKQLVTLSKYIDLNAPVVAAQSANLPQ